MSHFQRIWHSHYPSGLPARIDVPAIRLVDFLRPWSTEPGRIALRWLDARGEARCFEYSHLLDRCERWAAKLATLGATSVFSQSALDPANPTEQQSRPRVLLWLPNVPEFVLAYYGAMLAGCIVTAASPALKVQELAAQVRDAGPAVLITLAETAAGANEAVTIAAVQGCRVVAADALANEIEQSIDASREPLANPAASRDALAAEVAVLQYTSGTTGEAKGAAMTQRNLVANAIQNAHWFGWERDASIVSLAVLPLCHTWGMCCCLNSTMFVGGTLVLADQRRGFDADATAESVKRFGATVLYGSATMFHRLMDGEAAARRAESLATLRHVKAGAMLSQGDLKKRWDAFCPNAPLQQGYGLTEASPESHNNPSLRFKLGTVGVPIQSTDCRICDPSEPSRVLSPGEAGEVQLRGPQITAGYWRRPGATRAAFAPDLAPREAGQPESDRRWLRSGDVGVMDEEGYLSIVDRLKDLLKFRGYSISPNNIEDCLLRHPMVAEAVVVGRIDTTDGEVPTAFVVLRSADSSTTAPPMGAAAVELVTIPSDLLTSIRTHCERHLASYERPREYVAVRAIPKNHVAKPLRRVLRDWLNRA